MKALREIMREGFIFGLQRTATVTEAADMMTKNNIGIVAVLEGERLVGVFSERDVVQRVVARGLDPRQVRLHEVMTRDLLVADENEDYQTAMGKMDQANIRHLPVVRGGRFVSMLSIRDLMRVDLESLGEEIQFMREYLYHVPPEVARPKEKH
jgi:signal-transduction protein with cAMP-binding, CBS, and nucleotidyltransferase domain